MVSLAVQELFNFLESHLPILRAIFWAVRLFFQKFLAYAYVLKFFIGVSSSSFQDPGIKLKSLIDFELMLVQCERYGLSHIPI